MKGHDPETKLSAARTRLILDQPFLGALVLRLPLVAAAPTWCRTTATDARKFYYNPEYVAALKPQEAQFVLAHEALHCALSHFARRQHRLQHRWDLACDYAINPLLVEEGLVPPPNSLILEEYAGMTAEEIYPCLEDSDELETLDQHLYDCADDSGAGQQGEPADGRQDPQPSKNESSSQGERPQDDSKQLGKQLSKQGGKRADQQSDQQAGAAQPPPLSVPERDALGVQWQQRLAGAAQQALQAGKLGSALARMVDVLLQPQLPWRALLARYLSTVARDDYNYGRPSTRRGDPAIFPSLRSAQVDLVVAVDTSGSVSEAEMREFLSEIDALKGQIRARLTLHGCDVALAAYGPWVYEPWEAFTLPPDIRGGGGTSFIPIFDWVDQQDSRPDALVYFTDAQGEFPARAPDYPVVWLVKGRATIPWGERVQLN